MAQSDILIDDVNQADIISPLRSWQEDSVLGSQRKGPGRAGSGSAAELSARGFRKYSHMGGLAGTAVIES